MLGDCRQWLHYHYVHVQVKHLQFVSGVHTSSFWLANFLWDNMTILVVIFLSMVVIAAFQIDAFSAGEPLAAVVLLLVSLHEPVD